MPKGQAPKPSAIKILEGNRSKVARADIKQDPEGIGRPRVPANFDGDARRCFLDVVRSLPVGLLTRADESALEVFAREWATYREADAQIQKTGLLIKTATGPVRNPLLVVRNNAARNLNVFGAALGLSPAARARLATPNTADDDPMALLLGDDMDPDGAWSTLPRMKN